MRVDFAPNRHSCGQGYVFARRDFRGMGRWQYFTKSNADLDTRRIRGTRTLLNYGVEKFEAGPVSYSSFPRRDFVEAWRSCGSIELHVQPVSSLIITEPDAQPHACPPPCLSNAGDRRQSVCGINTRPSDIPL